MKTSIILVGAGDGERFGQPKLHLQLAGKTLLKWNLDVLTQLDFEKEIILVVSEDQVETVQKATGKGIRVVSGGAERIDSVRNGLLACTGDLIIIHNVANPLASQQDFERIQKQLQEEDCACFVGQPVVDTLRRVDNDKSETIDRTDMWRVQTPQGFRKASLLERIENLQGEKITDEVMLFEGSDVPIKAFPSSPFNQKITFPEDLEMCEQIVGNEVLVGIGDDSHYFDKSGSMVIGGVRVDDLPKLHGNSDGDLVLHSLFNAISSAIGERSIGPTADPMAEQGIVDSSEYLSVALQQARERGYRPQNLSLSLECSQPKVEPLVDDMKDSLSKLLELDRKHIGITATSGEGLSRFGKGEGIRCTCVVSLVKS